ncbi:MAG: glucoamylase family protein, partial [Massilia sp.]
TGLLLAGVLVAAQYFDGDSADEGEIRRLGAQLYQRANWQWIMAGASLICHGWQPETGFLQWHWEGYDEALILYLLALGSPTFPIDPACYAAWTATYEWKSVYGIDYLYAGPLFIHQMSHLWVDFRGLTDAYMDARGCDYFENSRRATLVQQQYAIRNPMGFAQYGEYCWGVTASDGPGELVRKMDGVERHFFDYVARGVPFGPDDGTIAPWAAAACLPFAPEVVLPTIAAFQQRRLREANPYGFKASFNPSFQTGTTGRAGWVSPYHFGINEGPTVIMIANHQRDFPWRLMRNNPVLRRGLLRAGFKGGWLDQLPATDHTMKEATHADHT